MVMNLMDEHAISMVTASTPRIDLTSARTYLKVHERGNRILKSQESVLCTVNLQRYLHPVKARIPRLILYRAGRKAKDSSAGYMYIFSPAPITNFAKAVVPPPSVKLHLH
jgi:hypothetical protein